LPIVQAMQGKISEYAYSLVCSQAAQAMQYEVRENIPTHADPFKDNGSLRAAAAGVIGDGFCDDIDGDHLRRQLATSPSFVKRVLASNESLFYGGAASLLLSVAKELANDVSFAEQLLAASGAEIAQYTVRRLKPVDKGDTFKMSESGACFDFEVAEDFGLAETRPARLTTEFGCSCQFPTCHGLPCRHMLRLHVQLQTKELSLDLFNKKWIRRTPSEVLRDVNYLRLLKRPKARCQRCEEPRMEEQPDANDSHDAMADETDPRRSTERLAAMVEEFLEAANLAKDDDVASSYVRTQVANLKRALLLKKYPKRQRVVASAQPCFAPLGHANLPHASATPIPTNTTTRKKKNASPKVRDHK